MPEFVSTPASSSLLPRAGRAEWLLVLLAVLVAAGLRLQQTEQLAVEHFDEGIYTAGLWYSDSAAGGGAASGTSFDAAYPASHLYAPPLLSSLIAATESLTGGAAIAPFLPSMICGVLTVIVVWWVARSWFGQNAGLFVLMVVALSEYHVQLSRFALTDVPALFLICLAVGLAGFGLQNRSFVLMLIAGIVSGLAWWMKYLGWLPIAIVCSGGLFWWLLAGRVTLGFGRLAALLGTMAAAAVVTFSPWLWMLQSVGGYSAVRANHAAYVTYDFAQWQNHLASHIVYQFRFDSWAGACSVAIGILAAANRRWIDLARSTWNHDSTADSNFPPRSLLIKLISGGVVLGIVALGISTVGLLTCVGIGGLAGIFLWRTLTTLEQSAKQKSSIESGQPGTSGLTEADRIAAPTIDPMIGTCLVTAWLLGLLVTTPLYQPFPRLTLPLVGAIWLAAAAGISWWIEANLNVARRPEPAAPPMRRTQIARQMLTGMILGAVTLAFITLDLQQSPEYWQDRTSLRTASLHLAKRVLAEADGQLPSDQPEQLSLPATVTPDTPTADGEPPLSGLNQLLQRKDEPFRDSLPLVAPGPPEAVVYTFGEPSVAFHLAAAGLQVAPVAVIPTVAARLNNKRLPTFFVLGPNALRTDGFMNEWVGQQQRFRHVRDFYFTPSDLVLLNLFTPQWLGQHVEARVQKLELYELRP